MSEPQQLRIALTQLAEDFSWLEQHSRSQPELAQHAGQLRLAAALTRNVLGAMVEKQPATPLHVAVLGGAGSGKSTVTNFLAGTVVAEANPQAGYTRHPSAYVPGDGAIAWPAYLGFLGPLRQLTAPTPANLDEDVYQLHRVTTTPDNPLADFVIWDCPDMTTWASTGYVGRLLEVAALADVVVYVASDERYNDAVPTQFLQMLVQAGKAVIVVLTKMHPTEAEPLIEHFRKEVLGQLTGRAELPPVPVLAIPHLTPVERNDPTGAGAKYRVPLLNQLLVLCPTPAVARERTIRNGTHYLNMAADGLLSIARSDLSELDAWRGVVAVARKTFEERYRREYLTGDPMRRFDAARQQMLQQLQPPGPARYVAVAFEYLRFPLSYAAEQLVQMGQPTLTTPVSERTVLTGGLNSWLDALQAETLRRTGRHAMWKQLARTFDDGLNPQMIQRFDAAVQRFEVKEGDELEQASRSLADSLPHKPAILGALRFGKLALDVAAVAATLYFTWQPSWYHLLFLPVAAAASHGLVEIAVRARVETARTTARKNRESLLTEHVTQPLSAWLDEWPATGGTAVERLQLALRRIPANLQQLTPSS